MDRQDEISFNTFLREIRIEKNISQEKLAKGLITSSAYAKYEQGVRIPNHEHQNRLLARLGEFSEEYEDYVHPEEYDMWKTKLKLIYAVEEGQLEEIERLSKLFHKKLKSSQKVEMQFWYDMKARELCMKNETPDKIAKLYQEAIDCTMKGIGKNNMEDYILSIQEYGILLWYLFYQIKAVDSHKGEVDYRYYRDWCRDILKSIKSKFFHRVALTKIYPMAVYVYISGFSQEEKVREWDNLVEQIDDAISCLRQGDRAYYLFELLEEKVQLLTIGLEEENDANKKEKIEKRSVETKELLEILRELFEALDVYPYMNRSGYIYQEGKVIAIGEVIRKRRVMFGMKQADLAEGICSERTLSRIEQGDVRAQVPILKELFDRLGLCDVFKRQCILTNDFEVLRIARDWSKATNELDTVTEGRYIEKLLAKVSREYAINRQALIRIVSNYNYYNNKINIDRYIDNMKQALEQTIPINNILFEGEGYLTDSEMECLYNLAIGLEKTGSEDAYKYHSFLKQIIMQVPKEEVENGISLHLLVLQGIANYLGDVGYYKESAEAADMAVKYALKARRLHDVHVNMYFQIWDRAMENKEYISERQKKEVSTCVTLSKFCLDMKSYNFYQKVYNHLSAGEADWVR